MVNKTIENWNNRNIDIKYKFQNQKMSTIAMDFKKKIVIYHYQAWMNQEIIFLVLTRLEIVNLMDGLVNLNQKIWMLMTIVNIIHHA